MIFNRLPIAWRPLLALALTLAALLAPETALAQLSFSYRTGSGGTFTQSLPYSSTTCATAGPRTAYVGGVVTNSGSTTITGINATMSGLTGDFTLSGGQGAVLPIGTLAPGASIGVYWLIGYGCVTETAMATVTLTSSAATVARTLTLNARPATSAVATGNVTSATMGPAGVAGQTVYFDVVYTFGATASGQDLFFQPTGGTNFNAGCFRLVGNQILSSALTSVGAGATNSFFFTQAVNQTGSGYNVSVRYFFQHQCANISTVARPYVAKRAGTTVTYSGNFDAANAVSVTLPGATNPFTITKNASASAVPSGGGQVVTYVVTIGNASANASVVSAITDTLPPGATYVGLQAGGTVTAANSASVPAAGATGTIQFVGNLGSSYAIAANGSVSVVYQVTMPSAPGSYANVAEGRFGQAATPVAQAVVTVAAPTSLSVTKVSAVYRDPVNAFTNPKAVPGGTLEYTILVSNPSSSAVTSDSLLIGDATPANLKLVVADINGPNSGPARFIDGSPATGLTYSYAGLGSTTDHIEFSNDNGATWTYVPVPGPDGADPLVTNVRLKPAGPMAVYTSFTLKLRYIIK